MNIYDFDNFKEYVQKRLQAMPKKGYGQYGKMADYLGMSSVMVSQIFKGDRHLPMEHAYELTRYFGLSELESRYFLLLVQSSRAGSRKYKDHLQKELEELRQKSLDLKVRLPADKELSESAKSIFYSDWIYSGVRLLSSIDGFDNLETIASHFEIPIQQLRQIVDFLLQQGLCVQEKGKIQMGPSRTHLEASSPFIKSRQISWRLKGFEQMNRPKANEDLYYTAPMALSKKTTQAVKKELVLLIQKVNEMVAPSPSEELCCLNIDWFKF